MPIYCSGSHLKIEYGEKQNLNVVMKNVEKLILRYTLNCGGEGEEKFEDRTHIHLQV